MSFLPTQAIKAATSPIQGAFNTINTLTGNSPSKPKSTSVAPSSNTGTQVAGRESIDAVPLRRDDSAAGAALGGGDTGIVLDPLGRRGAGGVATATLLGR